MSIYLKNKTNRPLLVGITGGIGSGKSTVAKIFEFLGVLFFNSDLVAKNIINSNSEVKEQIINQFGDVYKAGVIDKVKMAEIVFNDKRTLEKLNHIVHPKVRERFKVWVDEHKKMPLLIQEAAILIESGAYKNLDKIILVTAPLEERIKRVVNRDHLTEQKVQERMRNQGSDQEKLKYADFCIANDGKQLVIPQVLDIYQKLKSLNV